MPSIQTRLAAGLLLSLTTLLIIQWIVVTTSIHRISEKYIADRLMHTSDLLVAAVTIDDTAKINFDTSRIDPIYVQPFSGHYYRVAIGDTQYRSRSLWDEKLSTQTLNVGARIVIKRPGPQQQQLLILNHAYEKNSRTIQVAVAEDITSLEQDIDQMLYQHGAVSLFILTLLIFIQVIIIRKNLQPLEQVRKNLHKLETGLIDALNENVPKELVPLVKEINQRIKAVQHRLQRSRNSTGNLAHALKGPLTLLTQLANDDFIKKDNEIQTALLDYINNIQNIIERELKRARLSGLTVGARQAKLEPELQALIQSLNAMYHDKSLSITYNITPDCVTQMDREDMHEMLGNVLDNACKWATHKVHINIQCTTGLLIKVEDDGPGIPGDQRKEMLARGQRLDEQTSGHGLGLAIVNDVVEQYRGSISLADSNKLGGLLININLPNK